MTLYTGTYTLIQAHHNLRNLLIFLMLPRLLRRPRHLAMWLCAALVIVVAAVDAQVSPTDSLDLATCLDAALNANRSLIQARERIEEVEGDRVVVRSRLMPQVNLTAKYDALRTERRPRTDDQLSSQLLFEQRLFEFGPDAASEIQLRSDLRTTVYDYEDRAYEVLARVWEVFHLILLQERQIESRQASRDSFLVVLERQTARFEQRLASEEDKLRAEISVLEEELQINRLRRQQFNNKMELLRLTGQPIGTALHLKGDLAPFPVNQDEAVEIALDRDVQIGIEGELFHEQQRVVREVGWEYAPDLSVGAGLHDGRHSAGVSVDRDGRTWGVGLSSELALSEEDPPADATYGEGARWFANVEARIPIFEGGSRLGTESRERARLRRLSAGLKDLHDEVELQVRQSFQSMLEAEEEQRLQEQQVRIARRRLEIAQLLQEKGQADLAQLEQVREQFFKAQELLFRNQETYISRQAQLRRQMGYVE
ncbi:MAG: TolC family protein [Candidatus Latescibacterota bacterium]|nr:TolC family protein [Candidatus Latescibacterota bacterium]